MDFYRWLGLSLCLILLFPQVMSAQEDQQEEARKHFARGQVAYQQGDYERAIKEWLVSYELSLKPRIKYNLALVYERLGRLADAVHALQHYVDSSDPDDAAHSDAVARLASLQQRLALTGIQIVGGLEGSLIVVDGREWGRTPRPDKIFVKPGTHTVVIRHQGYRDFVSSVVVGAGQVVEIAVDMKPEKGGPSEQQEEPIKRRLHEEEESYSIASSPTEQKKNEGNREGFLDNFLVWFVSGGVLASGAIGSGIWWADRNAAISECEEPGIACENEDRITSQRDLAVGMTIGLSAASITAVVIGVLHLPKEEPSHARANVDCYPSSKTMLSCRILF